MLLSEGIWILPLRERLKGTEQLLNSLSGTDSSARIVAILDSDDPDYYALKEICEAFGVELIPSRPRAPTAQKINDVVRSNPSEGFYGLLANDIEVRTPATLTALAAACPSMGLSYCDDSIHGQSLPTHPCVSGDLVRLLGWWAFPDAGHNGIDIYLQEVANAGGGCKYLSEYLMYHNHPSEKRCAPDAVTERIKLWAERDRNACNNWSMKGVREMTCRKVRNEMDRLYVEQH